MILPDAGPSQTEIVQIGEVIGKFIEIQRNCFSLNRYLNRHLHGSAFRLIFHIIEGGPAGRRIAQQAHSQRWLPMVRQDRSVVRPPPVALFPFAPC